MAVQILRDTPITAREAIIPYTMAGINMLAATISAWDLLRTQALLVAIALIILGIPVSIYFCQHQYKRIFLNVVIMIPLLILTWALIQGLPGMIIDWSNPWDSFINHDVADNFKVLLHVLVIIAAGRTFSLVTQRDLLQTPIPSVSIFLLSAIIPIRDHSHSQDPITLICLFLLGVTSLYLLSQAHSQLWFAPQTPVKIQRQLTRWVLLTSLAIFPFILVTGESMRSFNMITLARYHAAHPFTGFRLPSLHGARYGIGFNDSIEMGGGQGPGGDQVIMHVQVKRGPFLLWRLTTYDTYLDGRWTTEHSQRSTKAPVSTHAAETILDISPSALPSDPGIIEAIAEKKLILDRFNERSNIVTQFYTINAPCIGPQMPIYGAYQITRFKTEYQPRVDALNLSADGGINVEKRFLSGEQLEKYEIESIIKPPASQLHLTKQVTLTPDDQNTYLQLPDAIRPRIYAKAMEILTQHQLSPSSDPLLIVREFENYLGKNYRYTLKPSPPQGHDDPICDFLLTQKKGYCNYFSGAMVMLCRSVQIPARIAVGFAPGEEQATGDARGFVQYTVSAKDAHSWVEVFLPHYGWYTSDPTAGSTEAPDFWGNTWDTLTEMGSIIKEGIIHVITTLAQNPHVSAYLSLGLATLLVLAAGLILWRRDRPPRFPQHELSPDEAKALLFLSYRCMYRWLKRWGITKPNNLTAHEFSGYFCAINSTMGVTVCELSDLYIQAQYGTGSIGDPEARRSITLLHQLWGQWREGHGQFRGIEREE